MKQCLAFFVITLAANWSVAEQPGSMCPVLAGIYTHCETIWPDGSNHQTMQDLRITQGSQNDKTTYQVSKLNGNLQTDVLVADSVVRPFLIDGGAAIAVWIQRKHECLNGNLKQTEYFPYSNNPNLIQTTLESFYTRTEDGDLQIVAQNVQAGWNVTTCKLLTNSK